jgi:NADH-quinone oxidoreductase subunit F
MMRMMAKMVDGTAEISDIDLMETITRQVEGHTICAFGDAAAWPIHGLLRHFRPLVEQRIMDRKNGAMPLAAE